MDNALFYTFSTIAQALAATFALLGAFVLFKLQQMSSALTESARIVVGPYLPNEEARRLAANGLFAELKTFLESQTYQRPGSIRQHTYAAATDAFQRALQDRADTMNQLKRALVLTAIVVAIAICVLAATPWIAPSRGLSIATLIAGVLMLVGSFALYGKLILRVVK